MKAQEIRRRKPKKNVETYAVAGNSIMQRRFIVLTIIGVSSLLASCGAGGRTPPRGFSMSTPGETSVGSPVYVTNINQGSVSAYLLDQTSGDLRRIGGSPFSTDRSSPAAVIVNPEEKFLIVANSTSFSSTVFAINATNAELTQVQGSPFAASANEIRLALHPMGNFVYGLSSTPAQIDGYTFDSVTGRLTVLAGFPVSLTGVGSSDLAVDPSGRFLYTTNPNSNEITSFSILQSGNLSPLLTTPSSTVSPRAMTFSTSGQFLFSLNSGGSATGPGSVSVFTVSSSGALTQVAGSPFAAGALPVSAVFSKGVLYVVNEGSANLMAFALDSRTGQLTQIKGSPYALQAAPVSIASAVRGAFLVVTNSAGGGAGSISVFSVAPDGTLSSVTGSPFTPDAPTPDQVVAF